MRMIFFIREDVCQHTFLGRMWTPIGYCPGLVHSSIWASVWLAKEQLMTKEGCPIAHPKLTKRPSANKMMWRPLAKR